MPPLPRHEVEPRVSWMELQYDSIFIDTYKTGEVFLAIKKQDISRMVGKFDFDSSGFLLSDSCYWSISVEIEVSMNYYCDVDVIIPNTGRFEIIDYMKQYNRINHNPNPLKGRKTAFQIGTSNLGRPFEGESMSLTFRAPEPIMINSMRVILYKKK